MFHSSISTQVGLWQMLLVLAKISPVAGAGVWVDIHFNKSLVLGQRSVYHSLLFIFFIPRMHVSSKDNGCVIIRFTIFLPGWNETAHARLGHAFAPRGVGKIWQNTRFYLRNSSCDWKWHLGVDGLPTINYRFDIWNRRSLAKSGIQCYIVFGISFEEDVVCRLAIGITSQCLFPCFLAGWPDRGTPQNLPKTWGPHLSWPPPVLK